MRAAFEAEGKEPNPGKAAGEATRAPRIRYFGDYELLEEIARGGMGVVYRARQVSLNRTVAVKTILAGHLASAADVERFRAEAQAAASLQHPNIVAIHEVGEHEGQQYFSMDYIKGRNLAEVVREGPLPARQAAAYLKTIAEAIHFAHQRGILHRDLKPSNVLLDQFDQPRLTDFGLAKQMKADSDLTRSGQVLGSPNFMPPEQAASKHGQVGPPSDVYSLGAILFHLLTSRPPFMAETLAETLQQVQGSDPISPRLLNPAVPRDVETICLKCLEKEPRLRYARAQDLAEELGRFMSDEPILARPIGRTAKAWRWCRRKPVLAGLAASTALLLLAVLIGSPIAAYRINRERHRAVQNLVRQYVANGNRLVGSSDFSGALPWFAESLKLEQDNPARTEMHRLRLAFTAQQCPKLVQLWVHKAKVNYAQFSPDGRWVVTACDDQTAQIWDATTGIRVCRPLQHTGRVLHAAFDPSSGRVVTTCQDGTARLWNATNGEPVTPPMKHSGPIVHAAFSPDGSRVLTSSEDWTAQVWDSQTGAAVMKPLQHKGAVRHAEFSRDGDLILTASDDRSVRLWDASTGEPVGSPLWPSGALRHAAFSPDANRILMVTERAATLMRRVESSRTVIEREQPLLCGSFSPDGTMFVLAGTDYSANLHSAADGKSLAPHMQHEAEVVDAGFSSDSQFIITASRDYTARVWDRYGRPAMGPLWHVRPVTQAAFNPDGHRVLSVSEDHIVRIWEISDTVLNVPRLHPVTVVLQAAFSRDGRRVLTVGLDGKLNLWSPGGAPMAPALTNAGTVRHAAFSPDGLLLATGNAEGVAQLWSLNSGAPASVPLLHTGAVNHVEFSPDGTRLVSASSDGSACVWDIPSGRSICRMTHPQPVSVAKFTPDGEEVVTATVNGWIYAMVNQFVMPIHVDVPGKAVWVGRWNARTGQPITPLTQLPVHASQVAFSPDGRRAVTSERGVGLGVEAKDMRVILAGHETREVHVWDVATGRAVNTMPLQHGDRINAAVFSPDGQRIVTASADHTARVWDTLTGQPLTPPLDHLEDVHDAAFAAGGRLIVTASGDRTARIWDAATGEPVSPPLKHHPKVSSVFVSPDGRRFLTTTAEPWSFVWTLPGGSQLLDDQLRQAQLLAGRKVDDTGGLAALTGEGTAALWRDLQRNNARDVRAAPEQVAAWRQYWTDVYEQIDAIRGKMSAVRHAKENDLEHALEQFNRVIAADPDDCDAYMKRSDAHFRRGDEQKAEADLTRVIELNPYYYDAYFTLAYLYLNGPKEVRSPEKALTNALRNVELHRSQRSLSLLGQAYYRLGQFDQAIKTLENRHRVESDVFKAGDWLFLAMSYHRLGEALKADEHYRKGRDWRQTKEAAVYSDIDLKHFDRWLAEAEQVLGKPRTKPPAADPPSK